MKHKKPKPNTPNFSFKPTSPHFVTEWIKIIIISPLYIRFQVETR